MRYISASRLLIVLTLFTSLSTSLLIAFTTTPPGPAMDLPAPVISSRLPGEVVFGDGVVGPETARPFFDYFSWQSFVALNWPAEIGNDGKAVRGVPSPESTITIASPGTRVWETYKTDWELFRANGAAPTPWQSYELPGGSTNPCGNIGDSKMIEMVTKMDSVIDGINQAFTGPLVDQNRNYARYEIHVNKAYYEKVADPAVQWYLFNRQSKDPTKPNVFPDGVIEIKAAWKELVEGRDDPSRFYSVNALIVEPGNPPTCRPARMGLVGLHIANKVPHFREWVWSTFEQIDNVPDGIAGHSLSFNNGTTQPSSVPGFDREPNPLPKLAPLPAPNSDERRPVQVTRFNPTSPAGQITPTTDQINSQWQTALSNSVFRFYKLVATQWPTVSDGLNFKPRRIGSFPFNSDTPFPANNVANTTMETYFQKDNCTGCHYRASQDDFSFLLALRAFKPSPPLPSGLSAIERARRITEDRIMKSDTLLGLREQVLEQQRKNKLP